MAGPRDDRETVASETSLASDDTVPADSARDSSPSVIRGGRPSSPPKALGRYTIIGLIGRGGMGQVYEAEDPELGRRVAIKMLREDREHAPTLLREAQALAKLDHPNVVTVHDVGSAGGNVFLVMQLVAGEPIDRWLKRRNAGPHDVVAAFRKAGLGLAAAHAAGLVHCDFKPANVLVDREGAVRVGDFGLARNPGAGDQVAGTPAYMAPEQFDGEATAASDQFSFCASLWEVLAGERPFAETPLAAGTRSAAERERRPMPRARKVPAPVLRALERGLDPDPAQRFASMRELLDVLAPRRWQGLAIAGGAAVVASIAVLALTVGRTPAPPSTGSAAPPAPPRLDASRKHALTSYKRDACAYAPAIMADGTVVFDRTERDAVDLYAMPLAGGTPRQLTSQGTWEWRSSRGRKPGEVIHLVHDPTSHQGASIAVLDVASARGAKLVDAFAQDAAAIGETIYYIPYTQAELRAWVGGKDTAVFNAAPRQFELLAASPAGDRLAIMTVIDKTQNELCLFELATARFDCLKHSVSNARPAFGVDGKNLYYASAGKIRRYEIATATDEVMLVDANPGGGIAVSPDGSALVYSTCGIQSQIVEATADPTTIVVDDSSAKEAAVGPHGELAWTRSVDGVRVLVVRTADGEMQLTRPDLGPIRMPVFSADGTQLVFFVGEPHAGLHRINLASDALPVQITDSVSDTFPTWVREHEIAFTRLDRSNIPSTYVVDDTGGVPRRVGKSGRTVHGARGRELLAASPEGMLWIDSKTGAERKGPDSPPSSSFARTSPSGKWVAYEAGQAGQDVWRISLDPPGKLEHVMALASGQTGSSAAIGDDGRVFITPMTWSGDLVTVPAAAGSKL